VRKFTLVIIIVVVVVVIIIIIITPPPLPLLQKSEGATNHQTNNRAGNWGGMA
jgi:competence protein ComGC